MLCTFMVLSPPMHIFTANSIYFIVCLYLLLLLFCFLFMEGNKDSEYLSLKFKIQFYLKKMYLNIAASNEQIKFLLCGWEITYKRWMQYSYYTIFFEQKIFRFYADISWFTNITIPFLFFVLVRIYSVYQFCVIIRILHISQIFNTIFLLLHSKFHHYF